SRSCASRSWVRRSRAGRGRSRCTISVAGPATDTTWSTTPRTAGGPGWWWKPSPPWPPAKGPRGAKAPGAPRGWGPPPPPGRGPEQKGFTELARREALVLVCGRYEGIDQRVIDLAVDEELSIGDYVLSGGEVPAMVVIEGVTRLLPGVLGNPDSARFES